MPMQPGTRRPKAHAPAGKHHHTRHEPTTTHSSLSSTPTTAASRQSTRTITATTAATTTAHSAAHHRLCSAQLFEGASLSGSSQRSSRVSFSQPPARAQERGRPRGGFFRASRSSVLGLPPFLCARPSSVKVQLHLQRTLDSQSVSL